jgi:glycosyltransferase involved in cell wall biosynthesis
MTSEQPTLLVFADDWGRHPSSCQHIVRELLPRHASVWVNTIGTRKPRLNRETFARVWEKLRHWTEASSGASALDGLRVVNPRMWPWFGRTWDRGINQRLLRRQLCPLLQQIEGPIVGITTLPIVADLVGRLPVSRWIYYCVDDFGVWPGLDGVTLQFLERKLVRRVDDVIAVSETLRERIARLGRAAQLLTHGVDVEHWQASRNPLELPALVGLERPLVVFWGVVDRRMDVPFVRQLAADLGQGTILLVGPGADPDPALLSLPRVVHLPPLPYAQLPELAKAARVLVMPYADLPVTRAMQPLKLKEYLATGRPAVVRNLPAIAEWADCCDVTASPEEFSRVVRQRIESGLPVLQAEARRRLASESWSAKAEQFAAFLNPAERPLPLAVGGGP